MSYFADNIRIVLVNTSHPGNIGAAARAMKTMGLKHLCLVQPKQYPCAEASARAAGAEDVLYNAQVFESLSDAIMDCVLVIGTSARARRLDWPLIPPRESAERLMQQAQTAKVSLVFGRERSGLTNEELDCCHYLMNIPANPEYSSLNLAAAVQVLSYELYQLYIENNDAIESTNKPSDSLATMQELDGLHQHLQQVLKQVEIISDTMPKSTLLRRLRLLFQRSHISQTEIHILRGILSAVQSKIPDQ